MGQSASPTSNFQSGASAGSEAGAGADSFWRVVAVVTVVMGMLVVVAATSSIQDGQNQRSLLSSPGFVRERAAGLSLGWVCGCGSGCIVTFCFFYFSRPAGRPPCELRDTLSQHSFLAPISPIDRFLLPALTHSVHGLGLVRSSLFLRAFTLCRAQT